MSLYVLVARHPEDGYEVVTKFPLSRADMEARMAPLLAEPSEWTYTVCRLDGLALEAPTTSDHFCPDCREWEGERICPNLPCERCGGNHLVEFCPDAAARPTEGGQGDV